MKEILPVITAISNLVVINPLDIVIGGLLISVIILITALLLFRSGTTTSTDPKTNK